MKSYGLDKHNAISKKLGIAIPSTGAVLNSDEACRSGDAENTPASRVSDDGDGSAGDIDSGSLSGETKALNLPQDAFLESNKSTGTIVTDAASSDSASSPDEKGDEARVKKTDSRLAELLAEDLADVLVFDEVSLDWFQCKSGIWQSISKTRKLENHKPQIA
ncbi:MAG: hypothetical protein EPN89_14130 [Methylovulum sp.]|nr:MAG: hypothetical protein EPN89_14130 [Methylovulum sp.]